jgi:putative SOS response-associated peptidase YedK
MASWSEVHDFSQPITVPSGKEEPEVVIATPMRFASVMHLDAGGARVMTPMRWGFAERSAKNPSRPKHMHARAETIDTLPTFAAAFARARGIVFVKTFNEGEELPSGKTRQWVINPRDARPIAIAVIFEEWTNAAETLPTFVMATTPANALITPLTDRMPAILPASAWSTWLGPDLAAAKACLTTFEDGGGWDIAPQDPPPRARNTVQGSLF